MFELGNESLFRAQKIITLLENEISISTYFIGKISSKSNSQYTYEFLRRF